MKKFLKHPRDQVGDFQSRVLLHISFGIAVGFAYLAHWSLALALTALFLYYEQNEDVHSKDQAWKDVYGAIVGLEMFVGVYLIVKLIWRIV